MKRNIRYGIIIIITIILSMLFTTNLLAKNRVALLIGNSNYTHGGSLDNPVHDVRALKRALENLGFTVLKYENCSQKTMKRAMDKFGTKLRKKDVGLFFYAGHGVQVRGHNYLIPTDAKLDNENDAEYDCVKAGRILAKMESAGSRTNIVILDACRDNPFERSWRRGTEGTGLAFMNAPSGSLIAYSTAPGRTALDGGGDNSPYTTALLKHIHTPNITVLEMFQRVRSTVKDSSGGEQTPWESTSLMGNFYFTSKGKDDLFEQVRRERVRITLDELETRLNKKKEVEIMGAHQKTSNYSINTLPSSISSTVVESDGIYVAHANGIVKDTSTGLEWKTGRDRGTDWNEARSWVQSLNLDGGGWRMPTMYELDSLYNKSAGPHNITPLLKITSEYQSVWSSKTRSACAMVFFFSTGDRSCYDFDASNGKRAFAVRSINDG